MAFLDRINRDKFLQYSEAVGIIRDGEHEDLIEERDEILDLIERLDSLQPEEDETLEYIRTMVEGLDDLEDMLNDFDSDIKSDVGKGSVLKRKEAIRTLRRRIRKTKRAARSARRNLNRMDRQNNAKELRSVIDDLGL